MCMHMLSGDHPAQSQPASSALISTIIHLSNPLPLINCPHCAAPNAAEFNFCHACGSQLINNSAPELATTIIAGSAPQPLETPEVRAEDSSPVCPACNERLVEGSRLCNHCGASIATGHPPANASLAYHLRLIIDGEESTEIYPLADTTLIGRLRGDIHFPYDDYMSSQHASITRRGSRFFLRDEGSRNGTLVRIESEHELKHGAIFLVGKQLFKFEVGE